MTLKLIEAFYEKGKGKWLFKEFSNSDDNKYQTYYCRKSKNRISDPPEVIQDCIRSLNGNGKKFSKDQVIEIVINRRRYIVSSDKDLLVAVIMEWRLPHRCYQFFRRRK